MIVVGFLLEYPWGSDYAAFRLWPGYGCRTAVEAVELILRELAMSEEAIIIDDQRKPWGFFRETVRIVAAVDSRGGPSWVHLGDIFWMYLSQ